MELIILKAHEKILSSESFFNIMKYYSDLKYAKNIKKIKVFKQKKIKSRSHIIFEPKINQPIFLGFIDFLQIINENLPKRNQVISEQTITENLQFYLKKMNLKTIIYDKEISNVRFSFERTKVESFNDEKFINYFGEIYLDDQEYIFSSEKFEGFC